MSSKTILKLLQQPIKKLVPSIHTNKNKRSLLCNNDKNNLAIIAYLSNSIIYNLNNITSRNNNRIIKENLTTIKDSIDKIKSELDKLSNV